MTKINEILTEISKIDRMILNNGARIARTIYNIPLEDNLHLNRIPVEINYKT